MDPFLEVKRDVESNVIKAQDIHKKLTTQRLSTQEDSYLKTNLKAILNSINDDLEDLDDVIKAIQKNPAKFNLNSSDVLNRSDFIKRTRQSAIDMKLGLNSNQEEDRKALFSTKTIAPQPPVPNQYEKNNAAFAENEFQQQRMVMRTQDHQMDAVLHTVVNLKEVAHVMGQEMDDQSRLLGEMEIQVDETEGKLGHGMKKMNEFIKANSSSKQQCTIICLIIALIVLLIMVFSM